MIRYKKIYILQSQRLNHQDFNDDPEMLMGLPPSEKTTEFWKRYDRQADTHDTKMTEDLSENLDVLLIFAALFSAINTAFISLTMPGLSSDPLTETNALLRLLVTRADNNTLLPADLSPPFAPSPNSVIVNCLLYASLSCSLLAAVGAMMAKEWLQSFDRTGQTGPVEEQGRFRQRKFNGVQQWHLESIIRSLPNILLLSVILFFTGVCLYLFPVNRAVASVVIAFSGGGAALCGVAIVAGATSPLCPYQSAASRALKRMGNLFSPLRWKGLVRAVVDLVVRTLPKLIRKILDAMHRHLTVAPATMQSGPTTLPSTTLGKDIISEQVEVAQAAGWLLGTTSNRADQIAAAQFICTLDETAYAFAFEDSETRRRLVFVTREAFDIWYSRPTESNQVIAELLGLVLCRVLLQPSKDAPKREDLINLQLYQSRSFGGTFLRACEFASTTGNYLCHGFEDREMILHIAFLLVITSRGPAIPEYQLTGISRVLLTGNTPRLVDVLLGLWAKIFCNIDPDKSFFEQSHSFGKLVEHGDNKRVFARDLSNAVIHGASVLSSVRGNLQSELHTMRIYAVCLQKTAELSIQIRFDELTQLIDSVAGLILSYADPLTSSGPGESRSELARVLIEAVLALHTFVDKNPRPDEIPITRDARAEQLRCDDLINAAVHIMVDNFERLATSELLPRVQPQALAWFRAQALAPDQGLDRGLDLGLDLVRRAIEYDRGHQPGWMRELEGEWEGEGERERVLEWAWAREQERERERERDLERALERGLERDGALDGTLDGFLDGALNGALNRETALNRLRDRRLKLAKDLAQRLQVELSILRILLWVWRTTSSTQRNNSEKLKIFISSCRLWAPLETRVDFTINGIKWGIEGEQITFDDRNRDKLLTPDDLNGIVEFAEDLQKDREKSEFIAHNADVGINRLYAHFNRRVDWNYVLYDLREQRTPCPRSAGKEIGMIW